MARTRKGKVKRRGRGGSGGGSHGGALTGMREGFKGIAGSMVGKESKSSATKRIVDVFWWIVTIAVGLVAIAVFYKRCTR